MVRGCVGASVLEVKASLEILRWRRISGPQQYVIDQMAERSKALD